LEILNSIIGKSEQGMLIVHINVQGTFPTQNHVAI